MDKKIFTVSDCKKIANDVYDMTLLGDASEVKKSGQFVNLDIEGLYLRRPISICDYSKDSLRLVFKVVGKGTAIMSHYERGDKIELLLPLGNGFDEEKSGARPLLVGGGVGVPPLLNLAKKLRLKGTDVKAVLGFNSSKDCILYDDFSDVIGKENVVVTTVDGSLGEKGFVTDVKGEEPSFVYACGPIPMLKNLSHVLSCGAEVSLESRMGCGFGACMGCSIRTTEGPKRVCKEGPVFSKEVLIW